MDKKTYTTPLLTATKTELKTCVLDGSVDGFDNNPGWKEEGDGGDPRSKSRNDEGWGDLW